MQSTSRFFKATLVAITVSITIACAGPSPNEQTGKQKQSDTNSADQQQTETQQMPATKADRLTKSAKVEVAHSQIRAEKMEMHEAQQFATNSALNYSKVSPLVHQDMHEQGTAIPNEHRETYQDIPENSVKLVRNEPVSTFSVDVDTGSYANVRRMLMNGFRPPEDAVRIEEFVNYFDYDYPQPQDLTQPFSITTDVSTAPWDDGRHLIRIGLQGYEGEMQNSGKNLVFLIDVSGSMGQANKLPLLKKAMVMLSRQLTSNDKVSIVVYAGASGVVLEPTEANDTATIEHALNKLRAGGSTNGASGIELAYQMAKKAYIEDGVNRVILATDGDFNVGMVNHEQLIELIEHKRKEGIALTTLGFGAGNYNDYLMEQLANAGNGNYAYIDTINEARKVLVEELSANMQIIAKDVKVQIEFNPNQVSEYRLIGYENRALANEDFNNDKVDAGDIGAGHRVTALYEITLVDSNSMFNDPLRYEHTSLQNTGESNEIAHVKLRYKQANGDTSSLVQQVILRDQIVEFDKQSRDFQFATAVAGFAQLIGDSKFTTGIDYDWVIDTAGKNKGTDEFGYRAELVQLARNAKSLTPTAINMR